MWTFELPTSVPVSSKKRFHLNLNVYRNAHHHTLNKAKVNFHDLVSSMIADLPPLAQVRLVYTLFTGTRQLVDTSNVCCIVDKFFSDVLVSCNKIPDDNFDVVVGIEYRYGGYDKGRPRVEVLVEPLSLQPEPNPEEPETMQIRIVETEIKEAVRQYINSQLNVREGMQIDITFSATRSDDGMVANIDIVAAEPSTGSQTTSTTAGQPSTGNQAGGSTASTSTGAAAGTREIAAPATPPAPTRRSPATRSPVTQTEQPAGDETQASDASEASEAASGGPSGQPTEEDLAPAGTTETGAAPRSLFGGLKTPINS